MAKTRIIAKSCPKCEQQVAVASKVCKCGYEFFSGKLRSTTSTKVKIDERRRTGRIRREKPNFYDSQQFEKKKKRQRRARQLVDEQEDEKIVDKKESIVARAKRRLKKKEESGNDPLSNLPEDKKVLASLILAEINRKIGIVQWKPE